MKRLLTILIAMLMVFGMFALVSSAEEELPEGAVKLDYAGYIHDAYFVILAGDNMTVGELTALGIGEEKDMNYFAIIVVDEYDTIIEINTTLGRPAGIKTDTVCPENGYIIGLNGNKEGYTFFEEVHVGDIVELINIDLDEYRGKEGQVALENAGFIVHDEYGDKPEYYLSLPITATNGVAVDEDTDTVLRDGQIYYFPGEADAERVVDSEEYNLRYSYIVICDENGYAIEAGNNLVFASEDPDRQNEITIPAGGYAFTFFYNAAEANSNQDLYDIYNAGLMGMVEIYNETTAVSNTSYQFVIDNDLLCVILNEVEDESSEEESSEPEESSAPEASEEESKEESKKEEASSTAPTTSNTPSADNGSDDGDSNLGMIIAIVVAAVAVVVIVVVIVIKKKK